MLLQKKISNKCFLETSIMQSIVYLPLWRCPLSYSFVNNCLHMDTGGWTLLPIEDWLMLHTRSFYNCLLIFRGNSQHSGLFAKNIIMNHKDRYISILYSTLTLSDPTKDNLAINSARGKTKLSLVLLWKLINFQLQLWRLTLASIVFEACSSSQVFTFLPNLWNCFVLVDKKVGESGFSDWRHFLSRPDKVAVEKPNFVDFSDLVQVTSI